jgi:hypothetical protein
MVAGLPLHDAPAACAAGIPAAHVEKMAAEATNVMPNFRVTLRMLSLPPAVDASINGDSVRSFVSTPESGYETRSASSLAPNLGLR